MLSWPGGRVPPRASYTAGRWGGLRAGGVRVVRGEVVETSPT